MIWEKKDFQWLFDFWFYISLLDTLYDSPTRDFSVLKFRVETVKGRLTGIRSVNCSVKESKE